MNEAKGKVSSSGGCGHALVALAEQFYPIGVIARIPWGERWGWRDRYFYQRVLITPSSLVWGWRREGDEREICSNPSTDASKIHLTRT